jgi:hypothetical protein
VQNKSTRDLCLEAKKMMEPILEEMAKIDDALSKVLKISPEDTLLAENARRWLAMMPFLENISNEQASRLNKIFSVME